MSKVGKSVIKGAKQALKKKGKVIKVKKHPSVLETVKETSKALKQTRSIKLKLPKVHKGPKGSSILEWNISKKQESTLLKMVKTEEFSLKELLYQEEGFKFIKKSYNLTNCIIGAFLYRLLKGYVGKFKMELK